MAETSMHNLLETDIEQVSQLSALVDAQLDYHRQAVQILDELANKLKRRMREASARPRREYKPKAREPFDLGEPEQSNGGLPCAPTPSLTASSSFRSSDKPIRTPSRSMRECPLPWHTTLPSFWKVLSHSPSPVEVGAHCGQSSQPLMSWEGAGHRAACPHPPGPRPPHAQEELL